jgi:hypothetical protein
MARYVTQRRVAVSWEVAVRFALREGLPLEKIRCTPDAELLHRTDWWAWWSDQKLTGAIGIPESLCPQSLTPDAVELIDLVWCNSSTVSCEWQILAQVERILERQTSARSLSSQTLSACAWERVKVRFLDGRIGILSVRWMRDIEAAWSCKIFILSADGVDLLEATG